MTWKSENVSQKTRRRGRPPVFAEYEKSIAKSWFPEVTTDRGVANICYQQRALCLLKNDPRFFWLGVDEAAVMAGKVKLRSTILQELGRIADEDTLRDAAEQICRLRPKARQAIAMIRAFRGVQRDGNALDLANVLVQVVNQYLDSHRTMAKADVGAAIRTLYAQVESKDW